MSKVTIIAEPDALTERLVKHLAESESIAGCQALSPAADDLAARLGECDAVVYAAAHTTGRRELPAAAAELAERVLAQCAAAGVGHLILLSSAAVNEASHHHAGLVSEDRLSPARFGNAIPGRWLEIERVARETFEGSESVLTVLRPAAVVVPGGRNYQSRLFAGPVAFTPAGYDPTLQLLHPDDLAEAVRCAVGNSRGGIYNVAPAGVIPLRKALRAAGTWRVPAPHWLHRMKRWGLAPLGLAASTDQLQYVRYPWTVSADNIDRELDFRPARSSAEAVEAMRRRARPAAAAEFDDFGMDKHYIARLGKTFFRFLHDFWWRIEFKGLEHIPREGRAVLTGIHRGHQPWDAVMTLHLLVRELGRYPRFLIHPTLVKFPFLAPYMIKCGGMHACLENAAYVLDRDQLLGVFPEGIRGAFSLYRDAYKLRKFGRDEFVKMALRHRAPIVPYVTVGSAEIFPIFANFNWGWWKRFTEWPYFPITPTMSLMPLPSKWHTVFLEPIHVEEQYPPEAADDLATVRAISAEVRSRIEAAIAEMLERRKSIFWGSIFEPAASSL
ncbi:MAG: NAD(P)H-binding protein, partial [bacterium]|nr:NAD(P)H-binding protein [bacterium]